MFRRLFATSKSPAVKSAVSAAVENLEERKLLAASPVGVYGIKIAKRVDADNTALNSNRITIAFQYQGQLAGIRLLDANQVRSFGYAEDLLNPGQQRKVTVGLTITQPEPGVLQIITDRLIRKGSRLFIYSGALTDTKGREIVFDGSTADKTITFTVGQNKPRYTMSNRNWRPTDLSYFTPDVFSSAPTPTVASTQPSSATIRTNLDAFLNAKVSQGIITAQTKNSAMAIFDDANQVAYIPDANIRAALVSLVGTVAEPAIASYIGKTNATGQRYSVIKFDPSISASAPIGETKISANGRLSLVIRPTYAGEDFRALSAILAQEAIHQDAPGTQNAQGTPPNSQDEEIIANAVQTNVYIQQAMVNNSFVANGTGLVNLLNTQALALLNSGDGLFPYGGIKQAPALTNDGNVFVGAKTNPGNYGNNTTVKSFEDWLRREYVSRGFTAGGTTGNAVASAILNNILGTGTNTSTLGTTVQTNLDIRNQVMTDVTYIRMAQALKLTY